jgi:hypothetical protein
VQFDKWIQVVHFKKSAERALVSESVQIGALGSGYDQKTKQDALE